MSCTTCVRKGRQCSWDNWGIYISTLQNQVNDLQDEVADLQEEVDSQAAIIEDME
ncbi:hypothetical protein PCANC_27058, partial [Puccinia coronata f. sp. avenae]